MLDAFKLEKLTIDVYLDADREVSLPAQKFVVQFNPSSFTLSHASQFVEPGAVEPVGSPPTFSYAQPDELKIQLLFDGTGAADQGVQHLPGLSRLTGRGAGTVADALRRFLLACYEINGDSHQPNYLTITWGQGPLRDFACRLHKADVSYTAFDRDGSPLRATVDAVFVEQLPLPKKRRMARLNSPDLSHSRTVRAGDSLPLLCREVYGSPDQHAAIARVNDLDSLRSPTIGTQIVFPPLDGTTAGGT
jgi:hypothetical protein